MENLVETNIESTSNIEVKSEVVSSEKVEHNRRWYDKKKYTSIGLSTSRKAGYSPHKLRATAATSLIGRGNSIFDVQALLDHEQVTRTQLYASHKMNVKRDLVKDMEWELERKERE